MTAITRHKRQAKARQERIQHAFKRQSDRIAKACMPIPLRRNTIEIDERRFMRPAKFITASY